MCSELGVDVSIFNCLAGESTNFTIFAAGVASGRGGLSLGGRGVQRGKPSGHWAKMEIFKPGPIGGGFQQWGARMDGWFSGKSHLEMDDDLGIPPHLWKAHFQPPSCELWVDSKVDEVDGFLWNLYVFFLGCRRAYTNWMGDGKWTGSQSFAALKGENSCKSCHLCCLLDTHE